MKVLVRPKLTGPVVESNCGGVIRPWRATENERPVRNARGRKAPNVNSIRWGVTGERAGKTRNLERRPKLLREAVARLRPQANELGGKKNDRVTTETPERAHHMFGEGMVGNGVGISSELPSRVRAVFMPSGPKSRPVEVRASVVAMKRLIPVEPRDAGK